MATYGGGTPQRSLSGDESDSDYENENVRPRGLTGLQNLGNTCYLNSAVQSLSNCPPLTQFFLDCAPLIKPDKSPMLSRSYLKLMTEIWHKKRPSYVVPSGVVTGIKAVHPMFRGYTQQDAQEFLRCLMDQLHEELKFPVESDSEEEDYETDDDEEGEGMLGGEDMNNGNNSAAAGDAMDPSADQIQMSSNRRPSFDSVSSQSSLDYETCDSGLSSERGDTPCDAGMGESEGEEVDTNDSAARTTHSVANTKEMKETANLLKHSEAQGQGRRRGASSSSGMEGGDTGGRPCGVTTKDGEMQTIDSRLIDRQRSSHSVSQLSALSKKRKKKKKEKKTKNVRYDSIISQTFDGKINSSVRCLNCETVSTTKEAFQDLSLPIPTKDHLHMLHSGHHSGVGGMAPAKAACGEVHQGWVAWMYTWMKSWFTGPTITLQDCLSAFFSADELKGDNMYSCEKCKKLRNGLKYSKVLDLPEILSIHLKRFRHEFYSSKINTYISFPLEGLDMGPYLHKDCQNEVHMYSLVAIICHHGTAGGGHYTAYCLNHVNNTWYEFDDQYVTEVDVSQVVNCEAYVLFYRKSNKKMDSFRQQIAEVDNDELSLLKFHVSKQWVSKFQTFAEPGPIHNSDFLCKHGGVPPGKVSQIDDLVVEIQQSTWEMIHSRHGGGPVCNHLYACRVCHMELEQLRLRQTQEKEAFIQLNEEFQEEEQTTAVYAISMAWFKEWEAFVREKTDVPPSEIDNSRILVTKNTSVPTLRPTSDHGQLSRDMWHFLHSVYGGGPEVIIRQATGSKVRTTSSSSSPTPNHNHPASSAAVVGAPPQSPHHQATAAEASSSASSTASSSATAVNSVTSVSPQQQQVSPRSPRSPASSSPRSPKSSPRSTTQQQTRQTPPSSPVKSSNLAAAGAVTSTSSPSTAQHRRRPESPDDHHQVVSLHHSQASTDISVSADPSSPASSPPTGSPRDPPRSPRLQHGSPARPHPQHTASSSSSSCTSSPVKSAGNPAAVVKSAPLPAVQHLPSDSGDRTESMSEYEDRRSGTTETGPACDGHGDSRSVQSSSSKTSKNDAASVAVSGGDPDREVAEEGATTTTTDHEAGDLLDERSSSSSSTSVMAVDSSISSASSGYGSQVSLPSSDRESLREQIALAKPPAVVHHQGKKGRHRKNKKGGKPMDVTRI